MKYARLGLPLVVSLFCFLTLAPAVHAQLPYNTLSTDADDRLILTQDAYIPTSVIEGFNAPEDLFISAKDEIYVADTGADRIRHLDRHGALIRSIPLESELEGEGSLRSPEGVFVTDEGEIVVADTGHRRIAVYDADGHYKGQFKQPNTELLPNNYVFLPSKVVLDHRGYMYVANKGGYQGLLLLTPEGDFNSFYGANKAPRNFLDMLKRKFYTEEQLKEEDRKQPGAVTNMFIDREGFIYTVNRDLLEGQLKRLNSGGVDLLGNINFAPWATATNKLSFLDVYVNSNGMMTAIASSGRIYQYDANGKMIFRFGNRDTISLRLGLFRSPTSLVIDSRNRLYVADRDLNMIQIFEPTEFGATVHEALAMYGDGRYTDAVPLWNRIRALNGKFSKAFQGIGKAEYKEGQYIDAMEYFKTARDKSGYSDSYWQVRMNGLVNYFGPSVSVMLAICALWSFLRHRSRKKRKERAKTLDKEGIVAPSQRTHKNGWLESLTFTWRVIRHPVNGMYDLANSRNVKWQAAVLLLLVGYAVSITGKYVVGFLFETTRVDEMSVTWEAMQYFLPILTWILGSYLIGSIMKGEATFKKVVIVNCYALMPMIAFTLPVQLLSNMLTLQESIIYSSCTNLLLGWVLLLMFSGLINAQNYNLKEALSMTTVSIFTVACIWLFGFFLILIFYQAYDFVYQVGREWKANV
ncbi:YIP1 family protein [Paenibacillus sp.]|uniref:YIP1 family protein n=1 Tax=Paenibacillus sp. TaxID=58172 RepID=UPI002811C092|nr:YIP1 family protein [Paenibacillus sp.]